MPNFLLKCRNGEKIRCLPNRGVQVVHLLHLPDEHGQLFQLSIGELVRIEFPKLSQLDSVSEDSKLIFPELPERADFQQGPVSVGLELRLQLFTYKAMVLLMGLQDFGFLQHGVVELLDVVLLRVDGGLQLPNGNLEVLPILG